MKWLGVFIVGSLAACAAADSAFIDFELGLIHPAELGGMECVGVEKYDNEDLGYTVFYRLDDAFEARVSVLNMGRSSVPDGPKGEGVEMMFEGVERLHERGVENGTLLKAAKRGATLVPKKGPIQFAHRVYAVSEPRVEGAITNALPRMDSVYLTGAKDHFIKAEFRFDVERAKDARPMAEGLARGLIVALATEKTEKDLLLAACDAAVYDPSSYGGRTAAQRVFMKAQEMGELNVYDALFVWPQEAYAKPENADLLIAAYFAGMLSVCLSEDLEAGGEREGFEYMMKAYSAMRERGDMKAIPRLEEWAAAADKGALFDQVMVEFGYAAPAE